MRITESKLRRIIRSVINESMYDSNRVVPSAMDDLMSSVNSRFKCSEEMVADAVCKFFTCDILDVDLRIESVQDTESYHDLVNYVIDYCRGKV